MISGLFRSQDNPCNRMDNKNKVPKTSVILSFKNQNTINLREKGNTNRLFQIEL